MGGLNSRGQRNIVHRGAGSIVQALKPTVVLGVTKEKRSLAMKLPRKNGKVGSCAEKAQACILKGSESRQASLNPSRKGRCFPLLRSKGGSVIVHTCARELGYMWG